MTDYLIDSKDLNNISQRIRNKTGTQNKLEYPTEFLSEIQKLQYPQGRLYISKNGVFDVRDKEDVNVEVPSPSGTMDITDNGVQKIKDYEYINVKVSPLSRMYDLNKSTEPFIIKLSDLKNKTYKEFVQLTGFVELSCTLGVNKTQLTISTSEQFSNTYLYYEDPDTGNIYRRKYILLTSYTDDYLSLRFGVLEIFTYDNGIYTKTEDPTNTKYLIPKSLWIGFIDRIQD